VRNKHVFRIPFRTVFLERPTIHPSLQENILSQLITLLDGVAAYYQGARNARKKARLSTNSTQDATQSNAEPRTQPTSTPPIISHITLGINEVTKALETEIRTSRQVVATSDTTFDTTQSLTNAIFICHADLDTPAIVAHLPQLTALCNSARPQGHKIKVVLLPAGAQSSLAHALGYTRRVSVMALDVCSFMLITIGADGAAELDSWTEPVGTSSCHRN
jgi:ribonuclease P/MRP protein subunit POP3